jgi:hypothetical protein
VVAFNNLIHGRFPSRTSQERPDERMVQIKRRAGFVAFLAAVAGMIILFTGLTFISGLGTADIYLCAWSYISLFPIALIVLKPAHVGGARYHNPPPGSKRSLKRKQRPPGEFFQFADGS